MKKTTIILLALVLSFGCKDKHKTERIEIAEKLDMPEKANSEWEILFDGSSFEHWKGYLKNDVDATWKIEDNAMVFYPPKERPKGESYNLVTQSEYTDFVLSLEWKISEKGNSGVFWGIKEDRRYGQPYATGPEIQVLDNEKHPDAKNGTSRQAGALYDMVAPSKDVTNPVGEWNTMIIMVDHKKNRGGVVLNDVEIVSFPVGNEKWNEMVSKSKFAGWDGFGEFTTGKIGLQDHGDKVAYRNIKIKRL
ncbi:DUF1080 domain-containing protein [Maribacter sp. 2304DJ31-5]|uniref:3-keto-disaccharide hydrolase n=1 Tax=Maribacter sp. 2304DJ31-5 TaxID=3386273 RepID=UPI0039BD1C90